MNWTRLGLLAAGTVGAFLLWQNRGALLGDSMSAEEGRMDSQAQIAFAGGGRAEPSLSRIPTKGNDEAGAMVAMNDGVEPAVYSNQRMANADYSPMDMGGMVDHDPRTVPHTTFGHFN